MSRFYGGDQLDPQYVADLRAGRRMCPDPLCPDRWCWRDRDEDDSDAPFYDVALGRYHDQIAGVDE